MLALFGSRLAGQKIAFRVSSTSLNPHCFSLLPLRVGSRGFITSSPCSLAQKSRQESVQSAVTIMTKADRSPKKTVLVLGASYAGHRIAQELVTILPSSCRVVVLDRNTHFNHLYAFPRVSVVPGHQHKVFVPYTKIFEPAPPFGPPTASDNLFVHGSLKALRYAPHKSAKSEAGPCGFARYKSLHTSAESDATRYSLQASPSEEQEIGFDYLVYALGSHLPPPINIWSTADSKQENAVTGKADSGALVNGSEANNGHRLIQGSKTAGMAWLEEARQRIHNAHSIAIIGGGPLGVQFASDVAWVYGTRSSPARWQGHSNPPAPKIVTLVSSSQRILPRFQPWMHEHGSRFLRELGVEVLTGARADMSTLGNSPDARGRQIKTLDGRTVEADLLLFCTGQRPNTDFLRGLGGDNVIDTATGMAYVNRHLQLTTSTKVEDKINSPHPHVFVIGDAAHAFGALNAGHTAAGQAEIAARNIARLIAQEDEKRQVEESPTTNTTVESNSTGKVNGRDNWLHEPLQSYTADPHKIKVSVGLDRAIRENDGQHFVLEQGSEDLNAAGMWTRRGLDISDMHQ